MEGLGEFIGEFSGLAEDSLLSRVVSEGGSFFLKKFKI